MGGLKEECGVVAIWTPGRNDAANRAYWALMALQHRGQEAAGVAAWGNNQIQVLKNTGLVHSALHPEELDGLNGELAIGHVRYSTTGGSTHDNAGPVVFSDGRKVAVAHNGNIVGAERLKNQLQDDGCDFVTSNDSELLAAMLAKGDDLEQAALQMMEQVKGAYALAALSQGKIIVARDKWGIRPMVLGRLDDGYVLASETCALDMLGATVLREVVPGEMLVLSQDGLKSQQVLHSKPRPCSFEQIYFARPDSQIAGQVVYNNRVELGRQLARDYPVEADLVIPVPDSGQLMAIGYAQKSGITFGEGLVKNRYVGRTFIEPTQEQRELALKRKFNTLPGAICGQRLVVVDDSLVRGSTMSHLIKMLKAAGAEEVHLRVAAPPTRHPCLYGIDMGREGDYIALDDDGNPRHAEQIAAMLGADSLHYLSLPGLSRALKQPLGDLCTACFTGDYPISGEIENKDSLS